MFLGLEGSHRELGSWSFLTLEGKERNKNQICPGYHLGRRMAMGAMEQLWGRRWSHGAMEERWSDGGAMERWRVLECVWGNLMWTQKQNH